jgi:aryl-alcohol dehydrogenase-like predicted oxidoreductase
MVPGPDLDTHLALVDALAVVAAGTGATVAQISTASVASRGEDSVPVIGARHREQLAESLGAADLALSAEDLAAIEAAIPAGAAAGDR